MSDSRTWWISVGGCRAAALSWVPLVPSVRVLLHIGAAPLPARVPVAWAPAAEEKPVSLHGVQA
jgi:hypothetical protein